MISLLVVSWNLLTEVGLTLLRWIETALDNGEIVFVLDKPAPGGDIVKRCRLLMQDKASDEYLKPGKWRELDRKELTFLTLNRPARRYLYLRYMITLLHWKSGKKGLARKLSGDEKGVARNKR